MDFLDLRLRVSDLIGNRSISDVLPFLTQQAETALNRRLRTQWQIDEFTPAWTGNEAPLPDDYLELVCPTNSLRASNGVIRRKPHYTVPGDIAYYASLPTVTTGPDGTNWLLQKYPLAYVYATGVEAAKHLRLADIGLTVQSLFDAEMQAIKIDDERARFANRSVQVRGQTP